MQIKLVILDRDGTINRASDEFVKSPEEWHPLPGSLDAISRLNHAGFHVVLATNQSGLGRGLFDMVALNAMHAAEEADGRHIRAAIAHAQAPKRQAMAIHINAGDNFTDQPRTGFIDEGIECQQLGAVGEMAHSQLRRLK